MIQKKKLERIQSFLVQLVIKNKKELQKKRDLLRDSRKHVYSVLSNNPNDTMKTKMSKFAVAYLVRDETPSSKEFNQSSQNRKFEFS